MGEQLRELAGELRERWHDAYFWADHQLLQAILAAIAVGVISMVFKYAETRMVAALTATEVTP